MQAKICPEIPGKGDNILSAKKIAIAVVTAKGKQGKIKSLQDAPTIGGDAEFNLLLFGSG